MRNKKKKRKIKLMGSRNKKERKNEINEIEK